MAEAAPHIVEAAPAVIEAIEPKPDVVEAALQVVDVVAAEPPIVEADEPETVDTLESLRPEAVLEAGRDDDPSERPKIIVGDFADVTEEEGAAEPKRRRRWEWRSRRRQSEDEEVEQAQSFDQVVAQESLLPDDALASEEVAGPGSDDVELSAPAEAPPPVDEARGAPALADATDASPALVADAHSMPAAPSDAPPEAQQADTSAAASEPEASARPREHRTWLQRIWSAAQEEDEPSAADATGEFVPAALSEEAAKAAAGPGMPASGAVPEPIAPEPAPHTEPRRFDLAPLDLSRVDRPVSPAKRRFLRRARTEEASRPGPAAVPATEEPHVVAEDPLVVAEEPLVVIEESPTAVVAEEPLVVIEEPPTATVAEEPPTAPEEPEPVAVFDTPDREFRALVLGEGRMPSDTARADDVLDFPVPPLPRQGSGIEAPAEPIPSPSERPVATGERKRGLFRKKRSKAEPPAASSSPAKPAAGSAAKIAAPARRAASTKSSSLPRKQGRGPARDTSLIWERAIAEVEATRMPRPSNGLARGSEAIAAEAASVAHQPPAEAGRGAPVAGMMTCPTCGQPSQRGTCQACRDALRELQELMQSGD